MTSYIPSEHDEQCAVVQYCELSNIEIFAIPNGGSRHILEAIKLKKSGVMPGVPDLLIPLARKGYHGLFIEMKAIKGGRTSQEQKEWIDKLTKNGYRAVVCKGFYEAQNVIDDYIQEAAV